MPPFLRRDRCLRRLTFLPETFLPEAFLPETVSICSAQAPFARKVHAMLEAVANGEGRDGAGASASAHRAGPASGSPEAPAPSTGRSRMLDP
jgi:hypothetical protein